MNDDRIAVMRQVLEGKLPADSVTWDEINEVEMTLMALIMEKKMETNPCVFSGVEGGMLC